MPGVPGGSAAPNHGRDVPLVERERELERIEALVQEACHGRGGSLLVEGEPGIGKTALLGAVRTLAAERGMTVLAARGAELEQDVGFGMARALFGPLLATLDPPAREDLLAGAARLAEVPLGLAAAAPTGVPASAGAALHGLYWLCANLADSHPLVVVIDDLQWVDEPSLRFVSYLARRAAEHRVLICAASRPPSLLAPGSERLVASLGGTWDEVVRPRPLSDAGVEQVVRVLLSPDAANAFCAACARASGGNPLLLTEALVALQAEGVAPVATEAARVESLRSGTLSQVLSARLARLGPSAVRIARAVAVLGSDATVHRVARLGDLDLETAATTLEGLGREGILASGPALEFAHPLVRTAIYADLAEPASGVAHRRAALLLDGEGAAVERVARHLLAAERSSDAWAVETLRTAAANALARGAPGSAVVLLERALGEPPEAALRAPLRLELGRALARTGRLDAAAEAMREALRCTPEPGPAAEIALELSEVLRLAGRPSSAVEVAEGARRALGGHPGEQALRLEVEIALCSHHDGRPISQWTARLQEAVARASGDADEGTAQGSVLALLAYAAAGSGDRSAADVARLAEGALELRPKPETQLELVHLVGPALAIAGVPSRARELLDLGSEAARQLGDPARFSSVSLRRARVALEGGNALEAEADARAGLDTYQEGAGNLPYALGVLTLALVARGQLEEAAAALVEGGLGETRDFDELPGFVLLQARGQLRAAQGKLGDAADDLARCAAMLTAVGFANPAFSEWRSLAALVHLGLGDVDLAERWSEEELELARVFGAPRAIGIALRARGLVVGGDAGLELLAESVSVLGESEARLELGQSQVALGAALRRCGRRRDAREPLRNGLETASRCGAQGLAASARAELVAAGARPRRVALSGPESLTAAESRVARLATEGRTNREIAQALFVTQRTVETHLTNVYRKLAITTREELDAVLTSTATTGSVPRPHT